MEPGEADSFVLDTFNKWGEKETQISEKQLNNYAPSAGTRAMEFRGCQRPLFRYSVLLWRRNVLGILINLETVYLSATQQVLSVHAELT